MAWIQTVSEADAKGRLGKIYKAAIERAGRVFGIVRCMSLSPSVLDASMGLYSKIMHSKLGLQRYQRELLATVVSRGNECHY
jgi:hypothetical protein